MKKPLVIAALLLGSFAAGLHAAPISYQPVVYQTLAIGTASGCDAPAKMVIRKQSEWERIWAKHVARDEIKMSAPPIDWSRKAVVVLLGGQTKGGSLELQHITREDGVTTIFYVADRDGVAKSQPYHFALIDAPAGPVKFADGSIDCSVCAAVRIKK